MRDENGLTFKQAAFVQHYTSDCYGNATQAAIKSGYSRHSANAIGLENLEKPQIKATITARLAEIKANSEITKEEMIESIKFGLKTAKDRNNMVAYARFAELGCRTLGMLTDNINTTDTQRQLELDAEEKAEAAEFARWRLSQKYGLKQLETQCKAIVKVG